MEFFKDKNGLAFLCRRGHQTMQVDLYDSCYGPRVIDNLPGLIEHEEVVPCTEEEFSDAWVLSIQKVNDFFL